MVAVWRQYRVFVTPHNINIYESDYEVLIFQHVQLLVSSMHIYADGDADAAVWMVPLLSAVFRYIPFRAQKMRAGWSLAHAYQWPVMHMKCKKRS